MSTTTANLAVESYQQDQHVLHVVKTLLEEYELMSAAERRWVRLLLAAENEIHPTDDWLLLTLREYMNNLGEGYDYKAENAKGTPEDLAIAVLLLVKERLLGEEMGR